MLGVDPGKTLSVKFGIYMCQMTIFKKVLGNCPTYFLSPYIYISYPILIIIHYKFLHILYYN